MDNPIRLRARCRRRPVRSTAGCPATPRCVSPGRQVERAAAMGQPAARLEDSTRSRRAWRSARTGSRADRARRCRSACARPAAVGPEEADRAIGRAAAQAVGSRIDSYIRANEAASPGAAASVQSASSTPTKRISTVPLCAGSAGPASAYAALKAMNFESAIPAGESTRAAPRRTRLSRPVGGT